MYREIVRFHKTEYSSDDRGRGRYYFSNSMGPHRINALSWSPDSTRIATAHNDHVVRIWDVQNRGDSPIFELPHQKFVISVAWSPDGRLIASGDTKADPIRIWDANTGHQLFEHYAHESWPFSLDWSPDGKHLVSAGQDGRVLVWDTTTWQILRELQPDSVKYHTSFTCVLWHPYENMTVFSERSQALWLWRNGIAKRIDLSVDGVESGAMGQGLAWCKTDPDKLACLRMDGRVGVWSLRAERFIASLPDSAHSMVNGQYRCVDWSPDGHEIATCGSDQHVRLWHKGTLKATFQADDFAVHALRWSPDGSMLATGGEDDIVRIWENKQP